MGVNIALDWDDTYTTDKVLWSHFVKMATERGHKVYIVTRRDQTTHPITDIPGQAKALLTDIIYCSQQKKREFTKKLGIKIDIWIDDSPEKI